MKIEKTIIYGFSDNSFITSLLKQKDTILIEPRKHILDTLQPIAGTLIKKGIYKDITETTMHANSSRIYSFNCELKDETRRERVFTTSIYDILLQYPIKEIRSFIFNIEISNLYEILTDLSVFNHIVSRLVFLKNTHIKHPILNNFILSDQDETFVTYTDKNINVSLPKIFMYDFGKHLKHNTDAKNMFTQQYNIREILIPKLIKNKQFHDSVLEILTFFFQTECTGCDIIVINNNDFFSSKRVMYPIYYPIQEDFIHLLKEFDIIYGGKSTMFLLYQMLLSDDFSEYLDLQVKQRPILRYNSKRVFYEYIEKIFKVQNIKY